MRWNDPRTWFTGLGPLNAADGGVTFSSLKDPALLEYMRSGGLITNAGISVTTAQALRNTTVLRCISLTSFSIGQLPLHLRRKDTKEKALDHPLFKILYRKPNRWQTAFEFRSFMQQRALEDGDAFALKVMSQGRLLQLVPINYQSVEISQADDFSLVYEFTMPDGRVRKFLQDEVFHVRYGLSRDGLRGISVVKQSAEAIGLALQAELAAAKIFRNGMIVGGILKAPNKLSDQAFQRLAKQMKEREGSENAGKSMVLEEGMEFTAGAQTGRDAQGVEQRKIQIEEIARPFGVPRPLLGVDDTSWGSGIGVLGQFYVRYGLNPWFTAWEQAITRDLLTEAEAEIYEAKFNASGLLRGSESEQAEFFAKALGSGGHAPWMAPAEVREVMDLPARDDLPAPAQTNEGTTP